MCEIGCHNGRNCLREVNVQSLYDYRLEFWESKPTPSQRRDKIKEHLLRARQNFLARQAAGQDCPGSKHQLCFMVDDKIVCEKAYTYMIAMQNDESGKKSKVWAEERLAFTGNSVVMTILSLISMILIIVIDVQVKKQSSLIT